MRKQKNSALLFVLFTCLLVLGTISTQAATDNEELCWPVTPAKTAPKNMQEIKALLESDANKAYFYNVTLKSGKRDTLSFFIPQYLDHTFKAAPEKKLYCWQHVYITKYIGADRPTVVHTSGYEIKKGTVAYHALARELQANMVQVEHRYTGSSKPAEKSYEINGGILNNKNFWDFCTANQAADDLAYTINTLKRLGIFNGQWVATGASKCGMTTTFLAMYRPSTCDVYVPFCAPFCKTLQEPLYHYVYAEYGGRLARHNKQDSITWDRSWLAIKDYLRNTKIQEQLKQKLIEQFQNFNFSKWNDDNYIFYFIQAFYSSQWSKATYFLVKQWQDLIPSRLDKDANPTPAYVDSMFTYLTANNATIHKHMRNQSKRVGMQGVQQLDDFQDEDLQDEDLQLNDFEPDDFLMDDILQSNLARRASEPISGIDADIYKASEYYVQTLYELGHVVRDYSYVYDLVGEEMYQKLTRNYLAFSFSGCAKVAANIGLNTQNAFYPDPKNPSGPKLYIGKADKNEPLMPKTLISPSVREFIKTTQVPILFVYGEFDPWTQSGITDAEVAAANNPNVQRFEVPSGTHSLNVRSRYYSSDETAGQTIVEKVKAMLEKAPTAIRTVTTHTTPAVADDAVYDLQGRRLTAPTQKGLYIKNGKLILKRQ